MTCTSKIFVSHRPYSTQGSNMCGLWGPFARKMQRRLLDHTERFSDAFLFIGERAFSLVFSLSALLKTNEQDSNTLQKYLPLGNLSK